MWLYGGVVLYPHGFQAGLSPATDIGHPRVIYSFIHSFSPKLSQTLLRMQRTLVCDCWVRQEVR